MVTASRSDGVYLVRVLWVGLGQGGAYVLPLRIGGFDD